MELREQRIILPIYANDGVTPLGNVHRGLGTLLAGRWGGFTCTMGNGAYQRKDTNKLQVEPVAIYDVAAEGSPEDNADLKRFAAWAAWRAGQEAVYVRFASGAVGFIVPMEPLAEDEEREAFPLLSAPEAVGASAAPANDNGAAAAA